MVEEPNPLSVATQPVEALEIRIKKTRTPPGLELTRDTPLLSDIWTHGESLRFATADAATITIWEVAFTVGATPTEVKTLPSPDDFDSTQFPHVDSNTRTEEVRFLPAPCRLAVTFRGRNIWDVRNSKRLLYHTDTSLHPRMSFSFDGRFFTCSTAGSGVCSGRSRPQAIYFTGCLRPVLYPSNPLLSRNGESIVAFGGLTIQL